MVEGGVEVMVEGEVEVMAEGEVMVEGKVTVEDVVILDDVSSSGVMVRISYKKRNQMSLCKGCTVGG